MRARDPGFKQEVWANCCAFRDRSVIRILNNVVESDTQVFTDLKYGTDGAGITNFLVFTCGTPSTTCEIAFFQNQADKGTAAPYGSFFEPASSSQVIPALGS